MDLINKVETGILNPLIKLMIAVAVAVFIWGIIEFIWNAANEKERSQGKRHIVWGLVGLLIMFAVSGIIKLIKSFVTGT